MREKLKRIQRFGIIPFNSFRERIRIINELQTKNKNGLRISIENENSLVVYEYFEFQ